MNIASKLIDARINNDGHAIWVEEDYCSPPLAMDRDSVLDRYFNGITVEKIQSEQEGWDRINERQRLWNF